MTDLPPAGWYPDPEAGGTTVRWWDGTSWHVPVPAPAYSYGNAFGYGVAPAFLVEQARAKTSTFGNWLRWAMVGNVVSFVTLSILAAATFRGRGFGLVNSDRYSGPHFSGRFLALQLASVPLSVVAYAYLGALIAWMYQAGKFADALGWPAARSRDLGVVGVIIPIVNFWWPYEALRDSYPPGPKPSLLLKWWVTSVIAPLLNFPMFLIAMFGTSTAVAAAIGIGASVQAVAAGLGWRVIRDVESMQLANSPAS